MVHTLVPSDRVEAASVYGRDGDKIGTIERLMLEKTTGMVAYAVVKWGGFLGTGQHHYPVPWSSLKYNLARRAYETTLTLEELRNGPSELDGEAFVWGDRSPVYAIRSIGRCRATNPCPFRKSDPDVLVVQPGQDWNGDNDTGPLDRPFSRQTRL